MNTLPKVAAEMALHVLAYNLTHVMNIIGIKPVMAAGQAVTSVASNAPAASVSASVLSRPRTIADPARFSSAPRPPLSCMSAGSVPIREKESC